MEFAKHHGQTNSLDYEVLVMPLLSHFNNLAFVIITTTNLFQFAILTELSRRKRSSTGRSNLLQNERFQLRLAPPLPFEND